MLNENTISKTKNVLLILGMQDHEEKLNDVCAHFCGEVVTSMANIKNDDQRQIYVCGDISQLNDEIEQVLILGEFSTNFEARVERTGCSLVSVGQVPVLVHDLGVFFKRFFTEDNLFERIQEEHAFQQLTESTKQSKARRTGIYLTDIVQEFVPDDGEVLHYRLLRCSSNLTGPTDNLRTTDKMIVNAINDAARNVFEQPPNLNHVLAQVYENKRDEGETRRERKAKISAHSDKTKDMYEDGLIAFCSFYDPTGFEKLARSTMDPYDWRYKKSSGLTQLYFKLKPTVMDENLIKTFSVMLYPNSVFFIPLSTNRLYTHEIRPSPLNIDRIPTRMGYVVRSSRAEAQFMNGQVYLKHDKTLIQLEPMIHQSMTTLRESYYQENSTDGQVSYGDVHFSMNTGDYKKPIY